MLRTKDPNPPAWLDEYMPLIEARLANPEATHICQIALALPPLSSGSLSQPS